MQVLFIEDDAMNRRVVRDMLSVAGVEMSEAPEAETGLAMLDTLPFDLVLMDLRMPGMDGLTAVRRIRARGDAVSSIPIIVVTADTAMDLQERCRAAGADDLLRKPVAMTLLFDAIARAISERPSSPAAVLA
ncbi:MAG TPA: response regulator [Caulobacteraceae bacterium]